MRLSVIVKPAARFTELYRRNGGVVVAVRERAIDGAANAAVVRAVAALFDIAPSQVRIDGGASAKQKRLRLEGVDEARAAAIVAGLPLKS